MTGEINPYRVTANEATPLIIDNLKAKLVPYISGSPGIGKSDMVRAISKRLNLFVIDVRLSSADPTDMSGFPVVKEEKGTYLPMDTFPIEGDIIPINEETGKAYKGWLVFFDELNGACQAVQKAAYKIILDRWVGNHKLHERAFCIGAGNLETDNALVEAMGTALQSRLIHLELKIDLEGWLDWASGADIDHRIIAFVRYNPEALTNFDPQHSDSTFSCPRTLHFASRLCKIWGENIPEEKLPAIIGTLGKGIGLEFFNYTKVYKSLPTLDQLINSPDTVEIPSQPDRRYALTGMIANHLKQDNLVALLSIVDRLPMEFQIITIQQAVRKAPWLAMEKEYRKRASVITRSTV